MSAGGRLLSRRLEELIANAPKPSALDAELRRVVRAQDVRRAGLDRANALRRANPPVQAAVLRAADRCLWPRSKVIESSKWAELLQAWLLHNYVLVGLERRPCLATIEKALKTWKPKPYGDFSARG